MTIHQLTENAILLLKSLIKTQSFSGEEDRTAQLLESWCIRHNINHHRKNNNVWAVNMHFDNRKPTLLLNSHHDTVRPNMAYTNDPFDAKISDAKLYGLGSNDAGGCLVALLATFTYYYEHKNLNYNLVFVGSAEEENSGPNGLNNMLDVVPKIDFAIVGEPTLMQLAVAEKGLVVFDVKVKGTSGHAAHIYNDNAIYNAIETLQWLKDFKFKKKSKQLGDVKITVTQIQAGKQHNMLPAEVNMVVDVRTNDRYTNNEIAQILKANVPCHSIKPRSLRLNSSSIPLNHPVVKAGIDLGRIIYGSPTLSDQAVLSCPSLKLGPGDSLRSHMANEFIYLNEIKEGIEIYIDLLKKIL